MFDIFKRNSLTKILEEIRLSHENTLWKQNIEEIPKTENRMFQITKNEIDPDFVRSLDPSENIIISTPVDEDIIKISEDDILNIKTKASINLSGNKILTNNISILDIYPRIKILHPKGIKLSFIRPFSIPYINSIHVMNYELLYDNELIIYKKLQFMIYIDLNILKRKSSTITMQEGIELIGLQFSPIYSLELPIFPNIQNIYWFQNQEIYEQFEEIFLVSKKDI